MADHLAYLPFYNTKRCKQEIEKRVEEGLEKLEVERSDINDKNTLKSGQTNVQRTS